MDVKVPHPRFWEGSPCPLRHRAPGAGCPHRGRPRRRGPPPRGGGAAAADAGLRLGLTATSCWLGDLARAGGDPNGALERYQESLALAQESGEQLFAANALDGVACAATARGRPERAARLHAAATLRERLGASSAPWEHPGLARDLAAARAALGSAAFEAAWAAGAALTLEQAVAEALAVEADDVGEVPETQRGIVPALMPRESEVLALLAEGQTDSEIAAALSISERTAGNHVQHIMHKLGVTSRTAAAVWAFRNQTT